MRLAMSGRVIHMGCVLTIAGFSLLQSLGPQKAHHDGRLVACRALLPLAISILFEFHPP